MSESIKELEIYLVRHAQSLGNIGCSEGNDDPVLSPLGERQAELLGKSLCDTEFDAVLSSPMQRAVQTALAVVRLSGNKVILLSELTENGVSRDCKGMTLREINSVYSDCFVLPEGADENAPLVKGTAGVEEAEDRRRAEQFIKYLHSRFHDGQRVLIVAHGAFNTDLFFAALGYSDEQCFDTVFDNTSVTRLVFFKQGTGPWGKDIQLVCLNDTAHLKGA